MIIFTDSAANLSPEKAAQLKVQVVPFHLTFMGKTYRDGVDIYPKDLYKLYTEYPNEFTTTSQPSVGDYVSLFEQHADEEILTISLSSGLSGAYSSAASAAHLLPNQKITVLDSRTVGPALGWIVEIAARGALAQWPLERILQAVEQVKANTFTMVGFSDLRHLINSGRVSHLKGIVASILHVKPIISMNDADGRYKNVGQAMTENKMAQRMVELVTARFGSQKLRMQVMHGDNLPGVETLRKAIRQSLDCLEQDLVAVTTVLGAHAGPTVIGLAAMPENLFTSLTA